MGSVYVPNGRSLDDDHYTYKLDWLGRLRSHLEQATKIPAGQLVVCGDWNIAPDDRDVWSVDAFEGSTHVSEPERDALAAVKEWGLVDVFRERYCGRRSVQLLGLPGRRFPSEARDADRLRPRKPSRSPS